MIPSPGLPMLVNLKKGSVQRRSRLNDYRRARAFDLVAHILRSPGPGGKKGLIERRQAILSATLLRDPLAVLPVA